MLHNLLPLKWSCAGHRMVGERCLRVAKIDVPQESCDFIALVLTGCTLDGLIRFFMAFLLRTLSLAGSGVLAFLASASAVQADQQQVFACIKQYTALGISADAALAQCQKDSVVGCVQRLLQSKFVASAIKFVPGDDLTAKINERGYLIDIGNTESRWLEGKQWKEKGCAAFTQGPYKRQSDKNTTFWNTERSYEWFRQGWCQTSTITLEQPYSLEEAKLRCELGITGATPLPQAAPAGSKAGS